MRLVRIEIRRALARRLTKMVLVVALGGIIAAGISVFFKSTNTFSGPSGAEVKAEQIQACIRGDVSAPGDVPPNAPGEIAPGKSLPPGVVVPSEGVSGVTGPPPNTPERTTYCNNAYANIEFGNEGDHRFHLFDIKGIYKALSVWLAIIGWLLGASYIGAEWRSGTMTTLLTWEPRRMRVMLTKLAATMIVVFGLVLLLQALLVGALYPSAIYRGTTEFVNADFWRSFSYQGLRIGGLAAAASALGFSAGSLGRNTAAGLGAGFVYIAVVEGGLLGGLIPAVRPWLILGNAIVFINNQKQVDIHGRTPTVAGLLLLGYAAGVVLIAAGFFKKRDVT
jgi:ABC-type transport system involved in multi-copper enzyme maturation permease subunit